jgi:hypothetical protein
MVVSSIEREQSALSGIVSNSKKKILYRCKPLDGWLEKKLFRIVEQNKKSFYKQVCVK